jgi:hypothetical protein
VSRLAGGLQPPALPSARLEAVSRLAGGLPLALRERPG